MTAPAWLESAEVEDAQELAGVLGIDLTHLPTTDAGLDAAASVVCRELSLVMQDLKRYEEAEALELQTIQAVYAKRKESLTKKISELEGIGSEIAKRATFPGKSKSRQVAFGSYGSRKVGERVEIVDEARAVAWLGAVSGLTALNEKVTIDKTEARKIVLAHLKQTGALGDGFEHVGATEHFFIRADK